MEITLTIMGLLLLLILCGIPIAGAIGLTSLITIAVFNLGLPISTLASRYFFGLDSFALMAIPFFIFAGELMNASGITKRVLDIAEAFVGWLKGGMTYVNCLAAMMMATISGSGSACAAALGVSLIPDMESRGYSREYSVALTSCANVVGPIIPPSSMFILYAYYTDASIIKLFFGGVIPGVITGLALMVVGTAICRVKGYRQEKREFSVKKCLMVMKKGWSAILVPMGLFLAIVTGTCTATEAGALVCVVSLLLGIAYRGITSWKDVLGCAKRAAASTCVIWTLLAVSGLFTNVLVRARFSDIVSAALISITTTPYVMLIIIVAFIFILGMFVDVTPMILMFGIPFSTCAISVGVDPTHFGMLFVFICMVGAVTPPVGSILFITTTIGKTSMVKVTPVLIPLLFTLLAVAICVIFVPSTVTFLPDLLFG